jgi:hypothetical protein
VTAGRCRVGLGDFEAVAIRIVFTVNRDQRRYAEAAFVFFAHLGAGAFRRDHDDGNVLADLHAFFNDVEAVRVREARAFLHQRHDLVDDAGVLFVGRQVENEVRRRDQLFESADLEAVFGGTLPGLAL